jgi:hypothetical protein
MPHRRDITAWPVEVSGKFWRKWPRAWSKLAEEAEEDDQLSGVELAGATFRPAAGRSASVREAQPRLRHMQQNAPCFRAL